MNHHQQENNHYIIRCFDVFHFIYISHRKPDKLTDVFTAVHFVEHISSGLPNEIMAINKGVVMVMGMVLEGSLVFSVSRTL